MATFSEIQSTKRGRNKGCPRCDADKTAGNVTITARELGPTGRLQGGAHITSRSISLCEACTVEVYRQVAKIVEALKR